MAALISLQSNYHSGSSDEDEESVRNSIVNTPSDDALLHLKPVKKPSGLVVALTPEIESKEEIGNTNMLDHVKTSELSFNPTYEQLYAPEQGPQNPFKTNQQLAKKNHLAGYVQDAHVNDFQFENQRKTFHSYGFAIDPSIQDDNPAEPTKDKIIMNRDDEENDLKKTVFEKVKKREGDKRKRVQQNDPDDIEGFMGPWGGFVDENRIAKPTEEEQKELDALRSKKQKRYQKQEESAPVEEKSTLHIKDAYDYQDRSFLHIPQDVGVNLKSDEPPRKCYLPKRLIHTWTGHTKAVSAIRLFPKSGHLLLSTSMDCKVKLWEVYNKRRLIRTYTGHNKAVRDACFNCEGEKFLTAAYDRYIKLWDTETGQCIRRFSNKKVPYCVKFNPSPSRQHFFVAGLSDKKICTWDTRSGDIVQEYDRHLGAVNSITFVDVNQRFVSTSDDKSLRVWEWDIPVDFKYIADPGMHSMPSATLSPNGKFLGCQSLDNKIMIFDVQTRFRQKRKKVFKGHMVAGYACQMGFSPDMSYVISGDGDGKLCIWDWKTTKLYTKFKAHDSVCIGCLWHPHETSKIITCGWDGAIKLWD